MKDPLADVEMNRRQALATPLLIVALLVACFLMFPVARAAILIGIGIALSIMLHECGHFIAAKRANMKVTEFFIGFGPRLWSIRKGETEYGIKGIPAGGYVRIIGMSNLEEVDPEDEARTFRQGSFKDKALVAVAGVAVNIIIFVLCMFIVLVGRGQPEGFTTEVAVGSMRSGDAQVESPAQLAGIKNDDWIVAVNGTALTDWDALPDAIRASVLDADVIPVLRDGATTGLELDPEWLMPPGDGKSPQIVIDGENVVRDVARGSAAAEAGLQVGDQFEVAAIEVTTVRDAKQVRMQLDRKWLGDQLVVADDNVITAVSGAAADAGFRVGDRIAVVNYEFAGSPEGIDKQLGDDRTAPVTVLRDGRVDDVELVPMLGLAEVRIDGEDVVAVIGRIGVGPGEAIRTFGPLAAAKESVLTIGTATSNVWESVQRIFSADGISTHVQAIVQGEPDASTPAAALEAEETRPRSVVGIVDVGSAFVNADIWNLFALIAGLNLFLALFNLIPLLPFDGGHLVVATYEKIASTITKRTVRVDYRKLLPITTVVTVVIVLYGVSVMFRDIRSAVIG